MRALVIKVISKMMSNRLFVKKLIVTVTLSCIVAFSKNLAKISDRNTKTKIDPGLVKNFIEIKN